MKDIKPKEYKKLTPEIIASASKIACEYKDAKVKSMSGTELALWSGLWMANLFKGRNSKGEVIK